MSGGCPLWLCVTMVQFVFAIPYEDYLNRKLTPVRPSPSRSGSARHRLHFLIALIYLIGIIQAELASVLLSPSIGFIFYAALLSLLLLHASREAAHPLYGTLLGLILVAVMRLLTFTTPPANFPYSSWLLIILLSVFTSTLMLARMVKLSRADIGVSFRKLVIQILVAPTGIVFGYVQYLIWASTPTMQRLPLDEVNPANVAILISAAILSELLFRGVFQRIAQPTLRAWSGVYVSIIYAVMYIGYGSAPGVTAVLVMALFYALVRVKTNSILGALVSHVLANSVLIFCIATGFQLI